MRKSLRKLKETDEIPELNAQNDDKKVRRRRKKEREPNILGGGLVILSLVVLFLIIRFYTTHSDVKGVSIDTEENAKRQEEKKRAAENVQSDLEKTGEAVKKNFGNETIMDALLQSADKVSGDIDAVQRLPAEALDTVKNMKVAEAVDLVVGSASRMSKVYSDIEFVRDAALEKVEDLNESIPL